MQDENSPTNSEIMMRLNEIKTDVRDVKQRLFGNGTPGLIRKVDRHDVQIQQWQKLISVVVGALVVILAGSTVTAAVWVIRAMG
jgi:hypothetical protein